MSTEDDTFDIDIYGDQDDQQPEPEYEQHEHEHAANHESYGYDGNYEAQAEPQEAETVRTEPIADIAPEVKSEPMEDQEQKPGAKIHHTPTRPQQGTKRKAEPDSPDYDPDNPAVDGFVLSLDARSAENSLPIDPNATAAIKLSGLEWWTTEENLRAFCSEAGVEDQVKEVAFGEHKINGKSRGEAYLELSSAQAAAATMRVIEKANQAASHNGPGPRMVIDVHFSSIGNPFRHEPAVPGNKQTGQIHGGGRGGAYNQNYNNQRGNFRGRGGFNHNRGGGYNQNNFNGMNQQQQAGWNGPAANMNGMNGNMGGFPNGGYPGNPMMNMMGGFGNMGRGSMMNNMMTRGGYGGMNNIGMGVMNQGGVIGGMNNMMGRGGWGGGFQGGMQQGFPNAGFQGGGGGNMQQQANKRARME